MNLILGIMMADSFCEAFDLRLWTAGFMILGFLGMYALGYHHGRTDEQNKNRFGF